MLQVLSSTTLIEPLAEAKHRLNLRQWDVSAKISEHALSSANDLSAEDAANGTYYLAECHYRKAFESETREAFEQEMTLANETWEKAAKLSESPVQVGSKKRAMARALYARFWLQ